MPLYVHLVAPSVAPRTTVQHRVIGIRRVRTVVPFLSVFRHVSRSTTGGRDAGDTVYCTGHIAGNAVESLSVEPTLQACFLLHPPYTTLLGFLVSPVLYLLPHLEIYNSSSFRPTLDINLSVRHPYRSTASCGT